MVAAVDGLQWSSWGLELRHVETESPLESTYPVYEVDDGSYTVAAAHGGCLTLVVVGMSILVRRDD